MLNEKGMTLIELLIAMVILISIMTASLRFYENYAYETSEFGEYLTAKHLTIKYLEEVRHNYLENGEFVTSVVSENVHQINGVDFVSSVEQTGMMGTVGVISQNVEMIKLTATTSWKSRKMEVSVYVSNP